MSTPNLTRNFYCIPFLTLQQLLLLWVSYFISCSVVAATGVVVPTDTKLSVMVSGIGAKQLDVSTYLEVTKAAMGNASLQDILDLPETAFEPLQDQTRFADADNNVYWIRASIRESSRNQYEHSRWLLVLENPRLTGYQMYIANSSVRIAEAFQAVAPIRSRYLVYPINLVANDTHQFYLKVGVQGVISIPAKIWQEEAYRLHKRKTLPGWGVLFGGLAALVLYNLLVMVSLRDKMYWYQSIFLTSGLLVAAYTEGFFLQFAPDVALLQWHGFGQFSQCLALISAILFTRCFLNTFYDHPVVERILMVALLMTLIMALLIAGNLVSEPFYLAGMVFNGLLFFIPSAIAAFNVSDRATRYFLVGWSVYIVGYAVYQFAKLGMIPANDVTMHMKEFSLGILAVTLSLGIASQIQRERSQKVMGLSLQQETMLELKYTEEQIQKKVLRDTLKEFPELPVFKSVCRRVIGSVDEPLDCFVVVMMELHYLAQVEHLLGHAARNELFTRAIKRLALVLRGISGVVPLQEFHGQYVPMAVLDSRRFAFILRGENVLQFNAAIEEIEMAMQRPFFYQTLDIELGISFGAANLKQNGHSFDDLFSEASRALQQDMKKNLLKRQGFEWGEQYNHHNIGLINQLREATQEDLVEVYFQPVYNLKTDQTCGVEVLTRWRTDQDEQISPNEIYYLAEMGGFVAELTLNVMRQAIRHFLDALGDSDQTVRLSVNLSPKCLRDERFLEDVGGLLSHYNMPAELLSFEIKEAAIIEDPNITRESLNRIRAMGIGLTIDEFAAAYSNPSYMSSLPVTEVKLDQRILSQVENRSNFESLLELIEMCRLQGINLVMHGVEDEDTLLQLEEMGCTFAQGHYFSAPVKAREFRVGRRVVKRGRYQRA